MDFYSFKNQINTLNNNQKLKLRKEYIDKFINTKGEFYQEQIEIKYNFIDGCCYLGYLWDCLTSPSVIEEMYIELISEQINNVYVFWDIHSCERIFIENYWRFDKDDILKLSLKTLLEGQQYLPEDIYIFDDSLSWTLIKTHEYINESRYCLKCGDI